MDCSSKQGNAVSFYPSVDNLFKSELFALLELVASKCTKKRWKSSMAVWILSLMMALEPPLHPDVHHLLRTIARQCRKLKKVGFLFSTHLIIYMKELDSDKKSSEDDLFFGLCPILVARNFGQLDLLESA
ncbi:survival of motor neuron protein-interacting protein 1 [Clonorchis sinensis]|uniref:Survival of motor neuron protein-interacting protein 1 n=1 Tax=Clonorchis sinensis TaxID=79923 RepID=G7YPK6_CLOSI|nr:survival of motor neuron protein-interacting protein 1 [Clonorchis sinensis]